MTSKWSEFTGAPFAPRVVDIPVGEVLESIGPWMRGAGPLYSRLAKAAVSGIQSGELRAGGRLPPDRVLAKALAVSRTTVVAAYDALRQDDYVERRRGSGTYVRRRAGMGLIPATGVMSSVQSTSFQDGGIGVDHDVIEFTAAALPGASVVSDAASASFVASLAGAYTSHGYSVLGLTTLRASIASYLTSLGMETQSHEILVTSGAQQAISLIASLFVSRDDCVLVEDPTWVGAIDAFRTSHARILSVPVDTNGIRMDVCADLVAKHGPKVLYLSPTFHNPTGVLMSESRRRQLVQLAAESGLCVIEDNTLAELALGSQRWSALGGRQNSESILTIGSMSKLFWGGLRIGWIRAPERLISRLAHLKLVMDHGSSILSQLLAVALLADIDHARSVRRAQLRLGLDTLKSLILRYLPDWSWREPEGGMSLFVRLPQGNATEFGQVAMRNGAVIVPGSVLSPSHSHADCLRLPYVLPAAQLEEGVRRLGTSWKAYVGSLHTSAIRGAVI